MPIPAVSSTNLNGAFALVRLKRIGRAYARDELLALTISFEMMAQEPTYRPAGSLAAKDVPNAGAHVLDAGHFALDTKAPAGIRCCCGRHESTEVNEREKS